METVQYEQELLAAVRTLPAEQVREVLDFATFLHQKLGHEWDQLQRAREEAARRMEARRRQIGSVGVPAADLVEEGRTA